jgi:hypothetical protein
VLEEQWIRNLLVTRQLLEQAATADDRTDAGAIAAVLLADLAVETVAKTAAAHRPPTDHPGDGYQLGKSQRRSRGDPSLLAVLDDVLASWRLAAGDTTLASLEIREAMQLHRHRNLVQHDAVVPKESTRDVARAEAFAQWIVPLFFGVELSEVSRASLVRDAEARGRLLLAEAAARAGDYRIAMAQLRVGFEYAIRSRASWPSRPFFGSAIKRAVGRATGTEFAAHSRRDISTSGLIEVLERFENRLSEIDDVVQALSVGADPVEFAWFLRATPVPRRTLGSEFWTIFDAELRSPDDYFRAYDFVVATLLRWQQLPPTDDTFDWSKRPPPGTTETPLANPPELSSDDSG